MCSSKRPDLNTTMGGKYPKCVIRRAIVVNYVSFDERIVVPKKERQHLFFVPDLRVEMNFHGYGSLALAILACLTSRYQNLAVRSLLAPAVRSESCRVRHFKKAASVFLTREGIRTETNQQNTLGRPGGARTSQFGTGKPFSRRNRGLNIFD